MYCYSAFLRDGQVFAEGKKKLAIGQAEIISVITHGKLDFNFAVLYCGDHHLIAGISADIEHSDFATFTEQASALFAQDDLERCSSLTQHYFGKQTYSLKSLFHDERQRIITQLVETSLADIDELYRKTHEQHSPQINFLTELHMPLPNILQALGEFVLGNAIRRCLTEEKLDFEQIKKLLDTAKRDGIGLTGASLSPVLNQRLNSLLHRWQRKPADLSTLQALESLVQLAHVSPFQVDLWEAQNLYYDLLKVISANSHLYVDRTWLGHFHKLGDELGVAPSQSFGAIMAYSVKESGAFSAKVVEPSQIRDGRLPKTSPGSQLPA
jgi:hypothetical protein